MRQIDKKDWSKIVEKRIDRVKYILDPFSLLMDNFGSYYTLLDLNTHSLFENRFTRILIIFEF